jgi:molybdenum cofactor biosynthesis enzyme MoaA
MTIPVSEALLRSGPIQQVRVDLTSLCNLRCVYCAVSHPKYRGEDMSVAIADQTLAHILDLAKYNALEPIDLNGHGETTIREGWTEVCFALIERGIKVRLTSNFAKHFSEVELEALASMETIAISVDSANPRLLRDVRRRVDLRQIVANIAFVRATALKLHRHPPQFAFLCGLYDKNTSDWDDFARFAVALSITRMELWSLTPHDGLDVPDKSRVRSLDELSDHELAQRLRSIRCGLELLRRHGMEVTVQGGFIDALERRIDAHAR